LIYKENISGDFSHADDICLGLLKLVNTKRNIDKVIFSSNKRTYINDIIKFILKKRKIKKILNCNSTKYYHGAIGDSAYAKKILNWSPKKNIFIAVDELNRII